MSPKKRATQKADHLCPCMSQSWIYFRHMSFACSFPWGKVCLMMFMMNSKHCDKPSPRRSLLSIWKCCLPYAFLPVNSLLFTEGECYNTNWSDRWVVCPLTVSHEFSHTVSFEICRSTRCCWSSCGRKKMEGYVIYITLSWEDRN